jgi:hypothetical protein
MTAMFTLVVPNIFQNSRRRGILDIRHQHTNRPGRFFTTKYDTTPVTRDRFPTSSAAPPIGVRRFRSFIFGLTCIGTLLPKKFEKLHNWAKPSPRFNSVIMHRTITGILREIREIEASSIDGC